jgi:hypothetical protein
MTIAPAAPLEVRDVLVAAAEARPTADRAEADLLGWAVRLVELHPVDDDTPVASWGPVSLLGDEPVAGIPQVADGAVEALGAALDVSYRSALALVSDALELRQRLPRLWALVQAGHLQAWRARRVAQHTSNLSPAAVAFVDRHAAVLGRRNRIPANLPALVHEALVRCDPEVADGREEAALAHRDVEFDFHGESAATATMTATLDLLDAVDLDAAVSDLAGSMGRLGDTSPLGVRRAHALGILAHPQRALDVFAGAAAPRQQHSGATLYLHVSAADLAEHSGVGRLEHLGSATLDRLADWLIRVDRVSVRPVLDLNRSDTVDRHDPPAWLRELVVLRDGHCAFPGCPVDSRSCDLDPVRPYRDPDDGGPPGQTGPANLAPLCRRHHRLETHAGWHYRRDGTGYAWTSPDGLTYRSDPTPRG